jgi:hypothetical protein
MSGRFLARYVCKFLSSRILQLVDTLFGLFLFKFVILNAFSHACILRHISQRANCPQCETDLDLSNQNHLIPNHTVAALIENARRTRQNLSTFKRIASEFSQDFHEDYNLLDQMITPLDSVETINNAIVKLKRRRTETSLSDQKKKSVLLNEFFDIMIAKRNKTIEKAMREIQILNADKKHVNVGYYI